MNEAAKNPHGLLLYRLTSRHKMGWWVFAHDYKEAVQVSIDCERARFPDVISLVHECTEHYRSEHVTDIDSVSCCGIAGIMVSGGKHCWIVTDKHRTPHTFSPDSMRYAQP